MTDYRKILHTKALTRTHLLSIELDEFIVAILPPQKNIRTCEWDDFDYLKIKNQHRISGVKRVYEKIFGRRIILKDGQDTPPDDTKLRDLNHFGSYLIVFWTLLDVARLPLTSVSFTSRLNLASRYEGTYSDRRMSGLDIAAPTLKPSRPDPWLERENACIDADRESRRRKFGLDISTPAPKPVSSDSWLHRRARAKEAASKKQGSCSYLATPILQPSRPDPWLERENARIAVYREKEEASRRKTLGLDVAKPAVNPSSFEFGREAQKASDTEARAKDDSSKRKRSSSSSSSEFEELDFGRPAAKKRSAPKVLSTPELGQALKELLNRLHNRSKIEILATPDTRIIRCPDCSHFNHLAPPASCLEVLIDLTEHHFKSSAHRTNVKCRLKKEAGAAALLCAQITAPTAAQTEATDWAELCSELCRELPSAKLSLRVQQEVAAEPSWFLKCDACKLDIIQLVNMDEVATDAYAAVEEHFPESGGCKAKSRR